MPCITEEEKTHGPSSPGEEETGRGSAREADAAAAMRVIRMAEPFSRFPGRRCDAFVEDCRRALRADTFACCRVRNDGDVEITACAGLVHGAESLEEAVASLPLKSRRPYTSVRQVGRRWIATAGRGSNFVLAVLPQPAASWTEDFLALVSDRLTHAHDHAANGVPALHPPAPVDAPSSLRDRIDQVERAAIVEALLESGGNQSRAARSLGITRNGLALKVRRLGIARRR